MYLNDEAFHEKLKKVQEAIIEWYRAHGDAHLPWRDTADPWKVLVAAFLLRKTTAKQVVRIYEQFLEKYPTPRALLAVSEKEVEDLIRPLGIEHQRARHLKELAKHIVEKFDGKIPCEKEKLLELPGVGEYIASEVVLVACGRPEPLLDRNMTRVIERVFGVKPSKKRPHEDRMWWDFARTLVPKDPHEAKLFNYGVLDFARKICTARKPRCHSCLLRGLCDYYSRMTAEKRSKRS